MNLIQSGIGPLLGKNNDVVLKKENQGITLSYIKSELKEEDIQSQQDLESSKNSITEISIEYSSNNHERMLNGNSFSLNGENGELKEIIEGNSIDFTIESDLRPGLYFKGRRRYYPYY